MTSRTPHQQPARSFTSIAKSSAGLTTVAPAGSHCKPRRSSFRSLHGSHSQRCVRPATSPCAPGASCSLPCPSSAAVCNSRGAGQCQRQWQPQRRQLQRIRGRWGRCCQLPGQRVRTGPHRYAAVDLGTGPQCCRSPWRLARICVLSRVPGVKRGGLRSAVSKASVTGPSTVACLLQCAGLHYKMHRSCRHRRNEKLCLNEPKT